MDKPTVQQVKEYADSIGFDIDAEDFLNFYDMGGWVYGKSRTPVASWEACVRTWKKRAAKRQKVAQGGRVQQEKRYYEPTVFVQCIKGPTTGRYLPIILEGSHLKDIPNEQYILAARKMCIKLNQTDGTEWVVRSDVTERGLMVERAAFYKDKVNFTRKNFTKPKKKGPLAMSKEIRKQVKEIKDAFHHPPPATDGDTGTDAHSKQLEEDCPF